MKQRKILYIRSKGVLRGEKTGVQLVSSTSICRVRAMTDYSQVTSQHRSTRLSVASEVRKTC